MGSTARELRYAVRGLMKTPVFTFAVVLTLALGIGATTAIFALVNGVLLRPLPFEGASRLAIASETGAGADGSSVQVSAPTFVAWRERARSFETIAAVLDNPDTGYNLADDRFGSIRLRGVGVTPEFFSVLKVRPMLGRSLEDSAVRKQAAILISHRIWRRHYGESGDAVGRVVTMNAMPLTIAGVMPPDFEFPAGADVWSLIDPADFLSMPRTAKVFTVVGRLGPSTTTDAAGRELSTISIAAAAGGETKAARVTDLQRQLTGDVRLPLLVLLTAAAVVLLSVCVNVTNLLLARSTNRQQEFAVRSALGASRVRMAMEVIVESVALALCGAGLGLLAAAAGSKLLLSRAAAHVAMLEQGTFDGRVIGFAIALAAIAGLVCGIVPAARAWRADCAESLRAGRGTARGLGFAGMTLVVAQVGMAAVLLASASSLLKTYGALRAVDPGFETANVTTMRVALWGEQYRRPEAVRRFVDESLQRVRAIAGVADAAAVSIMPFSGAGYQSRIVLPDGSPAPVEYRLASTRYLETVGIRLLAGRSIEDRDVEPGTPVAVVSKTFATRHFAGGDPLGRTITVRNRPVTIVGVVDDVKERGLRAEARETVYAPLAQDARWTTLYFVVKTAPNRESIANEARQQLALVDAAVPPYDVSRMDAIVARSIGSTTLELWLVGAFALATLALAGVGLFGLIDYSVNRQKREIGIRLALGAVRSQVVAGVVWSGFRLCVAGALLGGAAAIGVNRLIASELYGVSPADPIVLAATVLGLCGVGVVACYLPAKRASKFDPIEILKAE